jgi:flagellar basal body-associated protein FliL
MTTTMPASKSPTTPTPGEPGDNAEISKGRAKRFLVIAVAGIVVLAAAFLMVVKPMLFPPHYKPGQPVPNGAIVSLPSDTINLVDGHLLQLTVALQLTGPANTTKITAATPKFLNAELTVFGALTDPDLLNPAGRVAAQAALLQLFQHIAGTSEGAQQISALYFTSFIVQ